MTEEQGPPPYGQVPPGWGGTPPPPQPGQPFPYGYGAPVPPAPRETYGQATTSMVLGIVGLAGLPLGMACFFPALLVFLSPVAWVLGERSLSAIDASGGLLGGRGEATAGKIMGIVGTVLLVVGMLAVAAVVTLVVVGLASMPD